MAGGVALIEHVFPAAGTSMLPSILPGSRVIVAPVDVDVLTAGQIVAHVGPDGRLTCHRIVARDPARSSVTLRGDGQTTADVVDESAIVYRVVRVSRGLFGYDLDGGVGRFFGLLAADDRLLWRASRTASRVVLNRALRRIARAS